MTAQEIFDKVSQHLWRQGKRARGSSEDCLYRGPKNTSCAVGCLIPDNLYSPLMEGLGVGKLIASFTVPNYFSANQKLLEDLQKVHDTCLLTLKGHFLKSDLNNLLKDVAEENNLVYNRKEVAKNG